MNIEKLLNNKKPTGKEVGKALLLAMVQDNRRNKDKSLPLLFTPEEFKKMLNAVAGDSVQYNHYLNYADAYDSLREGFNFAQAMSQQIQHGYYRRFMYLSLALQREEALRIAESYPLILTQAKYNGLKEKAAAQIRGYEASYINVLFNGISYYTGVYGEEKSAAPPPKLKEILEAYKERPLSADLRLRVMIDYGKEDLNELPQDLTLYDLAAGQYNGVLEEFAGASAGTEKGARNQYRAFKKHFPELAAFMEKDIARLGIPAFEKIPAIQKAAPIITWGELADANIYAYPYLIQVQSHAILEAYQSGDEERDGHARRRGNFNGIAILQEEPYLTEHKIDEQGEFIDPVNFASELGGIDVLYSDKVAHNSLEFSVTKLIEPAFTYCYYYAAVIEALAEALEVPELVELSPENELEGIINQIEAANSMVYMLEKAQRNKNDQNKVKQLFPIIHLEDYRPKPEIIKAIRNELTDASLYHRLLEYVDDKMTEGSSKGGPANE